MYSSQGREGFCNREDMWRMWLSNSAGHAVAPSTSTEVSPRSSLESSSGASGYCDREQLWRLWAGNSQKNAFDETPQKRGTSCEIRDEKAHFKGGKDDIWRPVHHVHNPWATAA
eukprot:CAMPEP_0197851108 /NCGR_PEP_ID=MMETSP1438-20131217/17292_1 /TAXON_ID=1461541 /ORGANISM="Pterosperma sp., Strain CCMP1384" /LENGTH=113 /DNA_ID=CAMNT_0043464593 /DNA_START=84 /DNA_END=425 /DNA_ORIENTATION=+